MFHIHVKSIVFYLGSLKSFVNIIAGPKSTAYFLYTYRYRKRLLKQARNALSQIYHFDWFMPGRN